MKNDIHDRVGSYNIYFRYPEKITPLANIGINFEEATSCC